MVRRRAGPPNHPMVPVVTGTVGDGDRTMNDAHPENAIADAMVVEADGAAPRGLSVPGMPRNAAKTA
jgi:hypothetical protein